MAKEKSSPTNLDERLADFTDQILSNKPADDTQDLDPMEKTVNWLGQTMQPQPPERITKERIWSRLSVEWHKTGIENQKETPVWRSSRKDQRTFVLRFAIGLTIVVIIALLLTPSLPVSLPGTAGKADIRIAAGAIVIIILIGTILWRHRQDKNSRRKP
jgi:hypothetical protein